jgi:hypothetical protein
MQKGFNPWVKGPDGVFSHSKREIASAKYTKKAINVAAAQINRIRIRVSTEINF